METREETAKEIHRILENSEGKLFLGLVHYLYGPLRGLNVLIENPDIESVLDAIESQSNSILVEGTLSGISPHAMSESTPKNIVELNYKVWSRIGLPTQFVILSDEILKDCENPPSTYNSIEEVIKGLDQTLISTSCLQKDDPFFFRKGII
jgi:hypothetical protein